MEDDIAGAHQFKRCVVVQHRVHSHEKAVGVTPVFLEMLQIVQCPSGEIVNNVDVVPLVQIGFGQMGTDETSSSRDQDFHGASSVQAFKGFSTTIQNIARYDQE